MGPTGPEAGNENVHFRRHGVVLKLMLVVNLDMLLGQNGHLVNILFVAVMEFVNLNGIVKLFDLSRVGFLPKLDPHGIQHHLC